MSKKYPAQGYLDKAMTDILELQLRVAKVIHSEKTTEKLIEVINDTKFTDLTYYLHSVEFHKLVDEMQENFSAAAECDQNTIQDHITHDVDQAYSTVDHALICD